VRRGAFFSARVGMWVQKGRWIWKVACYLWVGRRMKR
jgi:hypothetical protein